MDIQAKILTHEEAKTKQLIPLYHIYYREDVEKEKCLVYVASKHDYRKIKTYDDFLNNVNKILEGKKDCAGTYVFENGKWNAIYQMDILDNIDIYRVEDDEEYEDDYARILCNHYRDDYVLREDLDKFIKNKQKKLVESKKIRKQRQEEYKSVFAWTNKLLDF